MRSRHCLHAIQALAPWYAVQSQQNGWLWLDGCSHLCIAPVLGSVGSGSGWDQNQECLFQQATMHMVTCKVATATNCHALCRWQR